MKVRLVVWVILILASTTGCQKAIPATSLSTLPVASNTPVSTSTFTPSPTATSEPLIHQPELISERKLNCSALGDFAKCIDNVLNIEFEHPAAWGEIEAVLRTGGYSGYAYDYFFGGETIAETEPLVAGGRSRDFSEGRGGMSIDFAGYGDTGMQVKESCDPNWQDLFPICHEVASDVTWMIRFPSARYICESAPGFYTTPMFRIEVNLPNNPTIHGFVFEAPFFSEQFSNEVESDLYPLLGLDSDIVPHKCSAVDRQAFDAQRSFMIEKITTKKVDSETQRKLEELIHLATSIQFR